MHFQATPPTNRYALRSVALAAPTFVSYGGGQNSDMAPEGGNKPFTKVLIYSLFQQTTIDKIFRVGCSLYLQNYVVVPPPQFCCINCTPFKSEPLGHPLKKAMALLVSKGYQGPVERNQTFTLSSYLIWPACAGIVRGGQAAIAALPRACNHAAAPKVSLCTFHALCVPPTSRSQISFNMSVMRLCDTPFTPHPGCAFDILGMVGGKKND
jgi:hypothetical protein